MKRIINTSAKTSAADRPGPTTYQPTYRESSYQRPAFRRLTPLSRLMVALVAVVVLILLAVLITQSMQAANGTQSLAERLGGMPAATPLPTSLQGAVPAAVATAEPAATVTPVPSPARDLSRAPWADKLVKQLDGTLLAPQDVVAKAMADLGGYYAMQRDLSLENFMKQRDGMLTTYFTGAALTVAQQTESSRDLYAMNRNGRFSIEVRDFSPDGLHAKAGVIKRDWISDIYDVATRQLVTPGRTDKDTLTIMSIVFDQVSQHWKFAATGGTTELKP